MKKLFYAVTGAVFLGLAAPVVGTMSEAWAEEVIGPDAFVPEGLRNGEQRREAIKEIGPGIREEENVSSAVGNVVIPSNDFLDAAIPNPVVKPAAMYSYDQMVADINALKERYGDKMQVNVIGKSQDGRDIYEVIVGNINAPKHILMQGAIHAREYMTPLLMMKQMETALNFYDTGHYDNMALSDLFNQVAVHFIPMSNPDGVTLAQSGLNGIRSDFLKQTVLSAYATDKELGRTTLDMDKYLTIWKSNAAGVDLNHNFPADWEGVTSTAVSASYSGYKGTAALSEPESQALAAMADKYPWAATISYHSMGNIIYWDTNTSKVKDASKALADSLGAVTGYQLNGSDGKGGYKDWMQSKDNPVAGVTIEVGSVACPLPLSEFDKVWQQNKAVWVQAMKFVVSR